MSVGARTLLGGVIGRVRDRLGSRAATLPSGQAGARPRSIRELRPEVAALALAGVSTLEIARRTGLAHDAIGLILHLGMHRGE